jgi:hypothetical protein
VLDTGRPLPVEAEKLEQMGSIIDSILDIDTKLRIEQETKGSPALLTGSRV